MVQLDHGYHDADDMAISCLEPLQIFIDCAFPGTFGSVTSLRVHMCEGKICSFRIPLNQRVMSTRQRLNSYKKSLKEVPHAMPAPQI